ncbi:Hint domain-containing protein [Xinfangfangia sp. D13-10-4-6]|uniref:Hint domain-containing protein n=1 Tax=Pseudogemmobacter hezensis TaxID=2737662 RepID=UPI001554D655|nr:Hint domain-containing protein [Pseudogemmobacter hezensis]NPD17078.1 Hint domain-containing protein [Pseudogemmobacter hezensis]
MTDGINATFVISWAQTEADGYSPARPGALTVGATWRWSGSALRMDASRDVLLLDDAQGMAELRQSAARAARRLIGRDDLPTRRKALRGQAGRLRETGFPANGAADRSLDGQVPEDGFILTDGTRCWTAVILPAVPDGGDLPGAGLAVTLQDRMRGALLAFQGGMPPVATDLWVVRCGAVLAASGAALLAERQAHSRARATAGGVVCFIGGTRIRTPGGAKAVEALRPGDLVLTRDNGPQEVLWTGSRHMSGARLHALPHLRPIRICEGALGPGRPDGDLLVSPSHRILMRGPQARALFNCDEVLVRAADLIDDFRIRTDLSRREFRYHHIMLSRHEILFANGVEADSFHPGEADPMGLAADDHDALLQLMPGLHDDPMGYGDFARRMLTLSEAALLRYDSQH